MAQDARQSQSVDERMKMQVSKKEQQTQTQTQTQTQQASSSAGSASGSGSGPRTTPTSPEMVLHSRFAQEQGMNVLHSGRQEGASGSSGSKSPMEPRERVRHWFPALPAYAMNDRAIARINELLNKRASHDPQERGSAESDLHALVSLHDSLLQTLNDAEEFLWQGAAVRGKDILDKLMND
jgi:hypothetical protein